VVAVTVIFPDPPDAIVIADGFVLNDTVAVPDEPPDEPPVELAAQLDVNCTGPEIWLAMLGFPTACTNSV
jgi:hypothetical protein